MNATLRWVGGTAVAALAIAFLFIPRDDADPRRIRRGYGDSLWVASTVERTRLIVLNRVVARGEAREFARAAARTTAGEPAFIVGPGVAPIISQRIEQYVRSELQGARAIPTRYPVAVVTRLDTVRAVGGGYGHAVVLPERVGEPCVVVISVPRVRAIAWYPSAAQRLLNTCAFYAAFGPPGEGTQRYLTETRGITARFLEVPSAYRDDYGRLSKLSLRYDGGSALTLSTLRCRLGSADACAAFAGPESLEPELGSFVGTPDVDRTPLRDAYPGVETTTSAVWGERTYMRGGLLGALAAELGQDRFGQIWRDPRGVREAYASAAGVPFESWVGQYLETRVAQPSRGPHTSGLALAVAVLLVGGALLLSAQRSRRVMT